MHFKVELFAELAIAAITLIFFYAAVSFKMFVQVAHLTESWVAVLISAFVRLLFGMDPKMSEKLTHALYHSIAFSFPCFRISVIALEQPVLLLQVIIFLNVVENVFVTIGNMICISEHAWVEILPKNNWNLVTRFNFISFHELCRKNILAEFKLQLVHTVHVHFLAAVELFLEFGVILLITPDLKWSIYFCVNFLNYLFCFGFLVFSRNTYH